MVYEVTLEGVFKKVVVVNAETRELAEDQALEEFRKINSLLDPLINASDRFLVYYKNENQQLFLKELKNSNAEMKNVPCAKFTKGFYCHTVHSFCVDPVVPKETTHYFP